MKGLGLGFPLRIQHRRSLLAHHYSEGLRYLKPCRMFQYQPDRPFNNLVRILCSIFFSVSFSIVGDISVDTVHDPHRVPTELHIHRYQLIPGAVSLKHSNCVLVFCVFRTSSFLAMAGEQPKKPTGGAYGVPGLVLGN